MMTKGCEYEKHRAGFKTDFQAKSSEKFVVKAGGEKGSEAYRCRSRTFFADNADPRILQPIAAQSSFETSSSKRLLLRLHSRESDMGTEHSL